MCSNIDFLKEDQFSPSLANRAATASLANSGGEGPALQMDQGPDVPVLVCQLAGLVLGHCPLVGQVALVAAQDDVGAFTVGVDL